MLRSNLPRFSYATGCNGAVKIKLYGLQLFCSTQNFNLNSDRVFRKTRRFHFEFIISAYGVFFFNIYFGE